MWLQILSFALKMKDIISNAGRTNFLFISILLVAVADFLIVKIIPKKYLIIKIIILLHGIIALIGNIVYWFVGNQ